MKTTQYAYEFKQVFLDNQDYPKTEVIVKCNPENLDEVVEDFALFLKGCGYSFDELQVVK